VEREGAAAVVVTPGQVKFEPREIEFPDQVHNLALCPANVKVGNELKQPDSSRLHKSLLA
jgi:hypothetical protein